MGDAHDIALYTFYGLCCLMFSLFGMEQIDDGGDDGEEKCADGKDGGEQGEVVVVFL